MRDLFPIFKEHPELIYLDTAATAHKPQCVVDAIHSVYAKEYATVHRAIYRGSLLATEKYNDAREAVRKFLNASRTEEIIFTRGTTAAINLVASSYALHFLKPGDEILISETEHHSNIVPWQMAAQKTGASLRWIPVDAQGVLQWENQITPKTKIVSLAHMSNVTGTIHPIQEIAKAAHLQGAILVVDGAQAAAHMPVDVRELDCDFYAFSAHKCYGPSGVGALFGRYDLLKKMPPIEGGGDMIERVDFTHSTYQAPPLRFEAGTPMIAPVIAFKAALDFIESIGRDVLMAEGQKLLQRALQNFSSIPRLMILGKSPLRGPIVTFHIEGAHPLDISTLLDLKNIAIRSGHLCAQPALRAFGLESAARASFGLYNTLEEIDIFSEALQGIIQCI
jgi:cysteine desulfurase/selenocysteine lyase